MRLKRALVVAGLILLAIGFVVNVNLIKGVGIGVFVIGLVAGGGT